MAELTDEDIQFIQELREAHEERRISRREALGTLGAAGVGAAAGFIGSGTAAADPSTSDSDGNVGTPDNAADVFAEGLAGPTGAPVDVGDSLIPDTDASYDLGATGATWNNLFAALVNTGAIGNGGSPVSVKDNLDLQSSQSITNAAAVSAEEMNNSNYIEPQATATASTSYTADLATANYHKLTLTGDVSIDITNVDSTDTNSVVLHLVQDGTGGHTPSFTPTVVWNGGNVPSWSSSANAEDVITLIHDQNGDQWLGFVGGLGMA